MSLYISTDIHNDWLWGSSLRECSKRALVETLIYWLSSFSGPTEGLTLKKQTRIVKSFINSFHFIFRLSARLNLFLSLSLSLFAYIYLARSLSLSLSRSLCICLPYSASLSLLPLHRAHIQDELFLSLLLSPSLSAPCYISLLISLFSFLPEAGGISVKLSRNPKTTFFEFVDSAKWTKCPISLLPNWRSI